MNIYVIKPQTGADSMSVDNCAVKGDYFEVDKRGTLRVYEQKGLFYSALVAAYPPGSWVSIKKAQV